MSDQPPSLPPQLYQGLHERLSTVREGLAATGAAMVGSYLRVQAGADAAGGNEEARRQLQAALAEVQKAMQDVEEAALLSEMMQRLAVRAEGLPPSLWPPAPRPDGPAGP